MHDVRPGDPGTTSSGRQPRSPRGPLLITNAARSTSGTRTPAVDLRNSSSTGRDRDDDGADHAPGSKPAQGGSVEPLWKSRGEGHDAEAGRGEDQGRNRKSHPKALLTAVGRTTRHRSSSEGNRRSSCGFSGAGCLSVWRPTPLTSLSRPASVGGRDRPGAAGLPFTPIACKVPPTPSPFVSPGADVRRSLNRPMVLRHCW